MIAPTDRRSVAALVRIASANRRGTAQRRRAAIAAVAIAEQNEDPMSLRAALIGMQAMATWNEYDGARGRVLRAINRGDRASIGLSMARVHMRDSFNRASRARTEALGLASGLDGHRVPKWAR